MGQIMSSSSSSNVTPSPYSTTTTKHDKTITPIGAARLWNKFDYAKHDLKTGLAHDAAFVIYINWIAFDHYTYVAPTSFDWSYDDRKYICECLSQLVDRFDILWTTVSDDDTITHAFITLMQIFARAAIVSHYGTTAFFSTKMIYLHVDAL